MLGIKPAEFDITVSSAFLLNPDVACCLAGEETEVIAEDESDERSSDERRQHDRARLIVDVHFDGGDATGVASTRDISLGGLYMSTQTEIPIGEILTLRIPVGSQHVAVKAEVVYSNPGQGVGVQFHDLPDEDRRLMESAFPRA